MAQKRRLRVLIIAPYYDKNIPGESWCTYKWVEQICRLCDATVLTSHRKEWSSEGSPTLAKEIVNWTHPVLKGKLARLDWELKPHYLLFYFRARRWLKRAIKAGFDFDLIHQINPVALRYPSPARNLGLPLVTGPHAGSLETPPGFRSECPEKQWFRYLRKLDRFRLNHDPILRSAFKSATLVLGVAPYVRRLLESIPLQRFAMMAETGPDLIGETPIEPPPPDQPLRLLFVGRIIRTKGVIDAIRALSLVRDVCSATLDIIGTGDMIDQCREEVERLGLQDRVTFHGRISRDEVNEWYRRSHVFLFPSFREPSGTVVFEAMGFGLPLITTSVGGPGHVITDECGVRVEPIEPGQFAEGLAAAIVELSEDRDRLKRMSAAALMRVTEVASWEQRAESLIQHYERITAEKPVSNEELAGCEA